MLALLPSLAWATGAQITEVHIVLPCADSVPFSFPGSEDARDPHFFPTAVAANGSIPNRATLTCFSRSNDAETMNTILDPIIARARRSASGRVALVGSPGVQPDKIEALARVAREGVAVFVFNAGAGFEQHVIEPAFSAQTRGKP